LKFGPRAIPSELYADVERAFQDPQVLAKAKKNLVSKVGILRDRYARWLNTPDSPHKTKAMELITRRMTVLRTLLGNKAYVAAMTSPVQEATFFPPQKPDDPKQAKDITIGNYHLRPKGTFELMSWVELSDEKDSGYIKITTKSNSVIEISDKKNEEKISIKDKNNSNGKLSTKLKYTIIKYTK
jgi:hypothetical protein